MTTSTEPTEIIPLEILQGMAGPHLLLKDVAHLIKHNQKRRLTQLILLTDNRGVEIGFIRYRNHWARYLFEPRPGILLTDAFLSIICSLTSLLTENYHKTTQIVVQVRDPLMCPPAINLNRMTAADLKHFLATASGK